MQFTAYIESTGEIAFCGDASDPALAAAGYGVIVGHTYGEGYIQNGQHHELPPQPTPHHIFDYATKQWIDPRTPETEWAEVRAQRNQLLQQSDWTQLPDVPLATKEAWAVYRQALRDVTEQPDPFNIVWPVAPG